MFGAGSSQNSLLLSSLINDSLAQMTPAATRAAAMQSNSSATTVFPANPMSPPFAASALFPLQSALSLNADILRLNGVHLNDEETELRQSTEIDEQPLDLSTKKTPRCTPEPSSSNRVSVIKAPGVGVKRSTSSVSYRSAPESDVSEHFRRSLSGKWPRRVQYSYSGGDSEGPSRRPSASSTPTAIRSPILSRKQRSSKIIINEGEVDDHFRKALGEEAFNLFKLGQTKPRSNSAR
ncbi:unnamed protein product [Bursaphelenchus xylophilus]|uniref:(pine wood nematode) hypothetical protein n=1 Tax=Bursaphelenchus xylophilus TaxID=6326 RepID=A0A1I7RHW4_BURXY|nr:unnamed protein product [Bursaphelenchus xylophilus]CAG9115325.1 unnamed protein product [Bursaphelenchus xylophilus]